MSQYPGVLINYKIHHDVLNGNQQIPWILWHAIRNLTQSSSLSLHGKSSINQYTVFGLLYDRLYTLLIFQVPHVPQKALHGKTI
jgi:hypothetical protein